MTACESAPSGLSDVVTDIRRDELRWRQLLHSRKPPGAWSNDEKADLQHLWRLSIENYSSLDLSFKTDKLMALAGIANVVRTVSNERYFAGLWERELGEQLAWRVKDCKAGDGTPSRRQALTEYRSPSWSWPSVDGIIELPRRILQGRNYVLDILDIPQIQLVDDAVEVGRVSSGFLQVQGHVYQLSFTATDPEGSEWRWVTDANQSRADWCRFYPDQPLSKETIAESASLVRDTGRPQQSEAFQCCVLLLAYSLVPVGQSPQGCSGVAMALGPGTFGRGLCRIGLVEFQGLNERSWSQLLDTALMAESFQSEAFDPVKGHTLILV